MFFYRIATKVLAFSKTATAYCRITSYLFFEFEMPYLRITAPQLIFAVSTSFTTDNLKPMP